MPYIPAGIGYIINEGLSRFFLNMSSDDTIIRLYGIEYTAADITGIFGACYKLSVFMMLFTQMFRMAWQPFFMRHAKDSSAPATFAEVFLYFNGIAAILFMTVALFVYEIAAIPVPGLRGTIIDARYWLGLSTVPMLLMAYWFQGWYTNFTAGIFISENTRMLPKITLAGAGITTAANLILIPLLGMEGAAWASVLSYGSMAMMIYLVGQKKWPIPYLMGRAWTVMIIGALAVFLSVEFPYFSSLTARAIILVIGSALVALITFLPNRNQ
jgi:O-antigen/teichoic acid export membrane protein